MHTIQPPTSSSQSLTNKGTGLGIFCLFGILSPPPSILASCPFLSMYRCLVCICHTRSLSHPIANPSEMKLPMMLHPHQMTKSCSFFFFFFSFFLRGADY